MTSPPEEPDDALHHAPRRKPFAPPSGESHLEAITAHVERHVGPVDRVLHEIVSDLVHLDILIVEATEARNHVTLVTSGMSELPMHVPEGSAAPRFAELVMTLIPEADLTQENFADERVYWPIRHMKQLARMPHELDTWLEAGQTVSTEPPEPVAPGVPFCALAVLELLDESARRLRVREDVEIAFLQVVALHRDELDEKRNAGPGRLAELFDHGALRVVFADRPNLCSKAAIRSFRRGSRIVTVVGVLLGAAVVADAVACYADGARVPWARLGFGVALAFYLGEGRILARWVGVALCAIGAVAGTSLLAQEGSLATWRGIVLAASVPVWAAAAVLLLAPPSVRFYYLGVGAAAKGAADEADGE